MKIFQGSIFGTRLPFKETLQVNFRRILLPSNSWILSGKTSHLHPFGYTRDYPDSSAPFRSTELSGKMDLIQLIALISGISFVATSKGGELLNVASLMSVFEAVSYTGDNLRGLVSCVDRSERMLYRGMVGKEFAVEVVHDSEIAMTLSVIINFFLALFSAFFGHCLPVMQDVAIRIYHISLLFLYIIAYIEKALNYKLAALISLLIETLSFSGRISNVVAISLLVTGFSIRIIKLITVIAHSNLYCHISTASFLYGTNVAKKILDSIPKSNDEILSRMHFARAHSPPSDIESATVSLLKVGDTEGSMYVSHELVEEVDDLDESCCSIQLMVSNPTTGIMKYDTSDLSTTRLFGN